MILRSETRTPEALQQHRHDLNHGSCCGRVFKTAAALEQHQRDVKHAVTQSANVSVLLGGLCCGKNFKTRVALLQHQQDVQHDTKCLSTGKTDSCTSIKSSSAAPDEKAVYCCGQRLKDEEARRQHCYDGAHGYSCKTSESYKGPSATEPILVEKGASKPDIDRLPPKKLFGFTFPRRNLGDTGRSGCVRSRGGLGISSRAGKWISTGLARAPTILDTARSLAAMSLSAAFGRQPEPSTHSIVDYEPDDEDGGVRLSEGIITAGPEILRS
ncbi:hypothetical protein LTR87_011454 [Friedmanniomyces endolithicus]|nr:hypothetical protein LTR87_011454 [Friedmanniomyces endolithicus]